VFFQLSDDGFIVTEPAELRCFLVNMVFEALFDET
jgi:hypothetical protein